MKRLFTVLTLMFSLQLFATDLPTAKNVEIERYVGKWYTITTLPQFFSLNCKGQTAEYEILAPGKISVLNTCIKRSGKTRTINGQAVVTNPKSNAELEVTFNSFFTRLFKVKGEYIIIKLDPNYEHVMVGTSSRKSLWIMSRTPNMPKKLVNEYVALANKLGFNTKKLKYSTKF